MDEFAERVLFEPLAITEHEVGVFQLGHDSCVWAT